MLENQILGYIYISGQRIGLSNTSIEGETGSFAQILWKGKILGQKEVVIQKKTFQIITELVTGKFRARIVEKSRVKMSWIGLRLYEVVKLVRGLEECSRSRYEKPFESSGDEEGTVVKLTRSNNQVGAFLLLSIHRNLKDGGL